MPILTIRHADIQSPTEFFYRDSGAPDRQVYTTLIVLHGLCFHSAVFQRVLPLATSKGYRMVCLNRRDYPGTTLYSAAELKGLSAKDVNEHITFLTARGVELAVFLDGLIDALSLPGPTADGKEGGLALMGWSMGNIFTLSTIASVSILQPQVQNRLQSYLRKLIMLDPPAGALGIPGGDPAVMDLTVPPQEIWSRFARWVSCYFAHDDISKHNILNLEFTKPNLSRSSVAASLSSEDFSSMTDYEAASRSDLFYFKFPAVLYNQMRKALFDPETRSLWPKLDVWLLYCDSSTGMIIHAAWEVEKLAKAHEDQPIQILIVEDAHHLVFWDEPEKAMKAFDHCLRHSHTL